MRARRRLPRLAALGGALTGLAAVFFVAVRPWYRRWGAAAFQVLTLAQPAPAVGAGLLAGAARLLREPADWS